MSGYTVIVGESGGPPVDLFTKDDRTGLLAFTEKRVVLDSALIPFLNPTVGTAMNQDVTFGSIPAILHDGGTSASAKTGDADQATTNKLDISVGGSGFTAAVSVGMTVEKTATSGYARVSAVDSDTVLALTTVDGTADLDLFPLGNEAFIIDAVWVGAVVQGAWSFTGGDVSLTSGVNNDQANFEVTDYNDEKLLSDYVAFTMSVKLSSYDATRHDMSIQLMLDGSLIGEAVDLNDFIDTGDFTAQQAVISIADDFMAAGQCNGYCFLISRSGGPQIAIDFDNMQFETGSAPLVFRMNLNKDEVFHCTGIIFSFADNVTSLQADTHAFDLAFDKILSISRLTNGILFRRERKRQPSFAANLRQISDFLGTSGKVRNFMSDGTNTYFNVFVDFPEPIVMNGADEDHQSLTIQDALASLLTFTCFARGSLEVL